MISRVVFRLYVSVLIHSFVVDILIHQTLLAVDRPRNDIWIPLRCRRLARGLPWLGVTNRSKQDFRDVGVAASEKQKPP